MSLHPGERGFCRIHQKSYDEYCDLCADNEPIRITYEQVIKTIKSLERDGLHLERVEMLKGYVERAADFIGHFRNKIDEIVAITGLKRDYIEAKVSEASSSGRVTNELVEEMIAKSKE
jgi:hypothetical protein